MTSALRRCLRAPWLLAALLWALAGHANALCTIVCSCQVTTTNVQFGVINPLSASKNDSTGTVNVDCGGVAGLAIPYRIDITKGGGTSYSTRRMSSGANLLSYNLYLDSTRLTIWGDGSSTTQYATGNIGLDLLGSSPTVVHTIYGRVPGSQTSTVPGTYTDTISVTLTYF